MIDLRDQRGERGPAAAVEHYKHALTLDPADLSILRSSATLLASLGRLKGHSGK